MLDTLSTISHSVYFAGISFGHMQRTEPHAVRISTNTAQHVHSCSVSKRKFVFLLRLLSFPSQRLISVRRFCLPLRCRTAAAFVHQCSRKREAEGATAPMCVDVDANQRPNQRAIRLPSVQSTSELGASLILHFASAFCPEGERVSAQSLLPLQSSVNQPIGYSQGVQASRLVRGVET